MKQLLLAGLVLAACGTPAAVPKTLSGDIPLTIHNNFDRSITSMIFWLDQGASIPPDVVNWLGDGAKAEKIEPHHEKTFMVRPGMYRGGFLFEDASGQRNNTRYFAGSGIPGSPFAREPIDVKGPTVISVGQWLVGAPPENVELVTLDVHDSAGQAPANCREVGASVATPNDCCSRAMNPETNVCIEPND